ncbi:uncharacterized protein EV422DRAFT_572419 [Fimicolochytrium jonesii]|uniref:uncharacterized protein n=1 Tax=Fimicolochytrium jonesii TaxID=1396493 RepID=UPI0022FEB5CC|nr:uncharacterized protein EV422DRAFT_572419 [Fimicolochytrium jonesii]KAI8815833.1 hypothetical protein EV422DRAFT_572419 [Fimicolochytrium jonesii]
MQHHPDPLAHLSDIYARAGTLQFSKAAKIAGRLEDYQCRKAHQHLLSLEQSYVALEFARKSFFRKHNHHGAYTTLIKEFQELERRYGGTGEANGPVSLLALHFRALGLFCRIRVHLLDIYQTLATTSSHTESLTHHLVLKFHTFVTQQRLNWNLDALGRLGDVLCYEFKTLEHLLKSSLACDHHNIKDAALFLYVADDVLVEWAHTISSGSQSHSDPDSAEVNTELYTFFSRWSYALTDKLGVFFHRVLMVKRIIGGMREELLREPIRLLLRYQAQTKAQNVSLIYLIRPDVPFDADGYACLHNGKAEPLTGLKSFPAVCSVPSEASPTHWPNIVSLLQRSLLPLIPSSPTPPTPPQHQPSYTSLLTSYLLPTSQPAPATPTYPTTRFYDPKMDVTYVLAQVVERLVMAVTVPGRWEERVGGGSGVTAQCVGSLRRMVEGADVWEFLVGGR